MKIAVLDYTDSSVTILNISDVSTEEEIEERLNQEFGHSSIEWMATKDNLKIRVF